MKKIIYTFADGTTSTVEVDDELYNFYLEEEKKLKSIDRKETRRHTSIEYLQENGIDVPADVDNTAGYSLDNIQNEKLEYVIQYLSDSEKEILKMYFYDGYKITEIAKMRGVGKCAVSRKLDRILKKIKKFLVKM